MLLYGLNYAPEPVGIGKFSGDMATWLAARGHQVRVVTAPPYFPEWQARGNRYRHKHSEGVAVWRCPLWVPRQPRAGVSGTEPLKPARPDGLSQCQQHDQGAVAGAGFAARG